MAIDSSLGVQDQNRKYTRRLSGLSHRPQFYPGKVTVNHWQLRDLVQPSSRDTNEILYTNESTISATDRGTGKVTTACKLDFQPRCFKEAHDKIVAGGVISSVNSNSSNSFMNRAFTELGDGNSGAGTTWRGLFSFYNRETQQSMSIRLGSYINNNVSINKVANSKYSSFICNNDTTLYNTLITNSSIVVNSSAVLDFPLNHSALSDDQKTLVVVGDSSSICLLHPGQEDSRTLHRDQIVQTPCDSGFSTSFAPSGLQFASCFQDGTCLIYDLRNISAGPLKRIHSTRRNSTNGAFRCVKYASGTDDLLLISEHVGRVHVVDTRDYNNHQVIVLPINMKPRSRTSSASQNMSMTSTNQQPQQVQEETNTTLLTPRVMEYNDIISLEGGLCDTLGGLGPSNSYATRNMNNYNLLSSMDADVFDDSDDDLTPEPSRNRESRESTSSFASSMGGEPEYGYSDNEISGVDWFEDREGSHIIIGYERGLMSWDIDTWSRRISSGLTASAAPVDLFKHS